MKNRTTCFRLTTLMILSLVVLLCFTACSAKTDIGEADDLTEDFLDLLLLNDYDGAYDLVKEVVTPADFKTYWDAMRASSEGADAYEIEQIGWSINTTNGVKYHVAAFEVTLNNSRTLFVRTTLAEGVNGIGGIFFNDTTEFNATYSIFAKIANVVLIVLSLLIAAFAVWMIVDCAKRNMKKKLLWIIIILLGVTFKVTFGQQLGFHLGVRSVVMFANAVADPSILSISVQLLVPVGAIVYFFMRKKLTVIPPAENTVAQSEDSEGTENPENPESEDHTEHHTTT